MNLGLTLIDDGAPPGGAEHDPAEAAAFAIHPPGTRAGLNPLKRDEFLNGLSAIRRACLALGRASGQTCLQLLDLEQIRYRFGRRWTPLRPKIFGIVESSLQRDLGRDDAYVAVSETLFYVFRIGLKRQDAERRGWLAAADITERLCGAIPGGVAVTVKSVPFDVGAGLAGVTSLEQLRNRVEAFSRSVDDAELRVFLDHAAQLQPWFRPTINLRKRLISAYHLEPVLQGPGDSRLPLSALCPASLNGIFDGGRRDAEPAKRAPQELVARADLAADALRGIRRGRMRGPDRLLGGRLERSTHERCNGPKSRFDHRNSTPAPISRRPPNAGA